MRARRFHKIQDVIGEHLFDAHLPHGGLQADDLIGGQHRLQVIDRLAGAVLRQDFTLGGSIRITDDQPHQEPIELTFRKRIGALEFEWVLRREHEEWRPEMMSPAVDRNLPFAHRFEQSRLRSRRGSIDLVRQYDLREDRARLKHELAGRLMKEARPEHVARQEVGCKLNPEKRAIETARDRLGQQRLPDARHVFDQQVPLG